MRLPSFSLHEPATLDEAVRLAKEFGPGRFDWVAGGTDLLPNYKWALNVRPNVISLLRVKGLSDIAPERIGALATLTRISEDPSVQKAWPAVAETAGLIATPLLRNSGTLGGNLMLENRCFYFNQSHFWRESKGFCLKAAGDVCLVVPQKETCYATFSADMPAILGVLDASIELSSSEGRRSVPLRGFYEPDGIHRNVRKPGELLTHVAIPPSSKGLVAGYRKLRLRGSWDFPEMGVAAAVEFEGGKAGGKVRRLNLCVNALETVPRFLDEVAAEAIGKRLDEALISHLADAARDAVRAYKNTFLPPDYRREMVAVFLRRLLADLNEGRAGATELRRNL